MVTVEDFHSSGAGRDGWLARLSVRRSARSVISGSSRQSPKAAIAGCTVPCPIASSHCSSCPSATASWRATRALRSNRASSSAPISTATERLPARHAWKPDCQVSPPAVLAHPNQQQPRCARDAALPGTEGRIREELRSSCARSSQTGQ